MKKVLLTLLTISLLFVTSCSAAEKYPYEHIGIYDTKTQQYIDIGDSKEKIDKILGSSKQSDSSYYKYDDVLSIHFDDNDNIDSIYIYFKWFNADESENERYALADGTDYNTTITEFINKYTHIYEGDWLGITSSAVSVILQNKSGEFIVADLDDIKEVSEDVRSFHDETIDDTYLITIEYYAYDDLSSFAIQKIPYPEYTDWENFQEIEQ